MNPSHSMPLTPWDWYFKMWSLHSNSRDPESLLFIKILYSLGVEFWNVTYFRETSQRHEWWVSFVIGIAVRSVITWRHLKLWLSLENKFLTALNCILQVLCRFVKCLLILLQIQVPWNTSSNKAQIETKSAVVLKHHVSKGIKTSWNGFSTVTMYL